MLVLSRKIGEAIGTGPDAVAVKISGLDRGTVAIGIQAPRHVRVDRSEVRDRIDASARAERAAAGGGEGAPPCPA